MGQLSLYRYYSAYPLTSEASCPRLSHHGLRAALYYLYRHKGVWLEAVPPTLAEHRVAGMIHISVHAFPEVGFVSYSCLLCLLRIPCSSNMSSPVLLPVPVASHSVFLGQLLSDPLNPEYNSFASPTEHSLSEPLIHTDYKHFVAHDDRGRLVASLAGHEHHLPRENIALVEAKQMSYTSIRSPEAAFDSLRRSALSRSFLCNMARQKQTLYYVTGVQMLKSPTLKKAVVREGAIAEVPVSPDAKLELPMHVRRDSASDVQETKDDAVFAVVMRKVRCHLGTPEEPHSIEDIGYDWTYDKLDGQDNLQLAIGLGKVLDAAELRALAGILSKDSSDISSNSDSSDDEGVAGF